VYTENDIVTQSTAVVPMSAEVPMSAFSSVGSVSKFVTSCIVHSDA